MLKILIRYESRLVLRSRLFVGVAGILLSVIAGVQSIRIAAVVREDFDFSWKTGRFLWLAASLLPTGIPLETVIISTITMSIVSVFLVDAAIGRDGLFDTEAAASTRRVTNPELVAGKIIAVLLACASIVAIAELPAMIYNLVDPDIAVDAAAYLYLPLLVFLPAFVFATGIVYFVHAANRHRRVLPPALVAPVAALGLLAMIPLAGIFDIFAVSSPLVLSPLAGVGGIGRIIARRAVVFSAGIALCGAATLLSTRPRQARAAYVAVRGIAALGAAAAVVLSFAIISSQGRGIRVRERMRKTGTMYGVGSAIAVTDCDLIVRHEGHGIYCTARMRIANGENRDADSYVFNLNPGLEITSVSSARGGCRRKREAHVLVVTPSRPLLPGTVDTLEIAYRGRIDEEAMYQYAAEQDRGDTKREKAYTFLRHARRYAFVEPGMVLLVPAAGWYPRAGAGFDPGDPSRRHVDFTRYSLDVTVAESLVPLSQGGSRDAGEGRWLFAPETPLAGISLVAAPYRTRSVTVDSITYRCHTCRDHDIGDRIFRALGDTIGTVVRGIREDMERKYGLVYPFRRFALVEVPATFSWIDDPFLVTGDAGTQPEMVFVPERKAGRFGGRQFFGLRAISTALRGMNDEDPTPERTQAEALREVANPHLSHRLFLSGVRHLVHPDVPVLEAAFDAYIASRPLGGLVRVAGDAMRGEGRAPAPGNLSALETVNMSLTKKSIRSLAADTAVDRQSRAGVVVKGAWLFRCLEASVGEETFTGLLDSALTATAFERLDGDALLDEIGRLAHIDAQDFLADWYMDTELPAYEIGRISVAKALRGDRELYNIRICAANTGTVGGMIEVEVLSGGRDRFARRYLLDGGEAKEFGMLVSHRPRRVLVHTLVSRNLPETIAWFPRDGTVEDPEEILDGSRSVSLEEITGEEAGIIVDNEDDGFEIKRVETGLFGRLLPWKRDERTERGYVGLARNDSPRRWTFVVDRAFYGGIVRSACVIRAGHGERGVSWNATLPRSGRYDVYAYLPRMRVGIGISDPFMYDKPYRYLLAHGEGTTDVEIVPYRRDDGWILLGRYSFSMGPARVELSDGSTRGPIIADAVKWVPVDDVTR